MPSGGDDDGQQEQDGDQAEDLVDRLQAAGHGGGLVADLGGRVVGEGGAQGRARRPPSRRRRRA